MANKKDAKQNEFLNFDFDLNGEVARFVIDSLTHQKLDAVIAALGGDTGTPFFSSNQATTTPGSELTIISETVNPGDTIKLRSVRVTCRKEISYSIEVDGIQVGSGRLGAAKLNDDFVFGVDKDVLAGSTIEIKVSSVSASPTDVEAHLQGLIIN